MLSVVKQVPYVKFRLGNRSGNFDPSTHISCKAETHPVPVAIAAMTQVRLQQPSAFYTRRLTTSR